GVRSSRTSTATTSRTRSCATPPVPRITATVRGSRWHVTAVWVGRVVPATTRPSQRSLQGGDRGARPGRDRVDVEVRRNAVLHENLAGDADERSAGRQAGQHETGERIVYADPIDRAHVPRREIGLQARRDRPELG